MRIIVTGGAGFIGSNFIHKYVKDHQILNYDKLTYAGNLNNLGSIEKSPNYSFVMGDINDELLFKKVISDFQPDKIINFAAESHVDRSIDNPENFLETNILGTFKILNASLKYFNKSDKKKQNLFSFLHISTDEVYGSLGSTGLFKESTSYDPSSPYSASKASSDHLVKAWFKTYGLPVMITNCSNNYGPYQFPEKLIPSTILKAINGKQISIYGNGQQIRDWLFVDDHVQALYKVATEGKVGETYNIGGNCEKRNIEVVEEICSLLDEIIPLKDASYHKQIKFVSDRPGHDQRYAINTSKISNQLGWEPKDRLKDYILGL